MVSPTRQYGRYVFNAGPLRSAAAPGSIYTAVNGTAVTEDGIKRSLERQRKYQLAAAGAATLSKTQQKKLGLIPKKPPRNPYKD